MTHEAETVLLIRGAIASMDQVIQKNAAQAYAAIRALEEKHGAIATGFAVALRGAELAAAE